jgi:hypothetical protein
LSAKTADIRLQIRQPGYNQVQIAASCVGYNAANQPPNAGPKKQALKPCDMSRFSSQPSLLLSYQPKHSSHSRRASVARRWAEEEA